MGRPSILYARGVMNGKKLTNVIVGGSAVTVGRGELQIAPE